MIKFNEKLKKTVSVEFDYRESCAHVYKTFSVHIDGKKSNIVGLKKFLEVPEYIPDIIKANTYFWHPAGNASSRHWNETRNNEIVDNWLISEGFTALDISLNDHFPGIGRRRGETIGIDDAGYYFSKWGEKYHVEKYNQINSNTIEIARNAIIARKNEKRLSVDYMIKKHGDLLVRVSDSVNAGNCQHGTNQFKTVVFRQLKKQWRGLKEIKAIRLKTLLKLRNDEFTQRAARYAIVNR